MMAHLKTCAAAAMVLLCGAGRAAAGPTSVPAMPAAAAPGVVAVQYYGYPPSPYWRRPYGDWGPYRPYAYGPGPRWYRNHYGPGAAKERYRTRLDFCRNQPERC